MEQVIHERCYNPAEAIEELQKYAYEGVLHLCWTPDGNAFIIPLLLNP